MRCVALIALPLLALAACHSGGEANDENTPSPQPNAGTASGAPSGTATPAAADSITSDYTMLDLPACTVTDSSEEGASTDWRCPGRGTLPLFVHEGDGRFDIDAGVENAKFQTLSAFNSLGDQVEWRMKDGRPFAVVFRFTDATQDAGGRSVLAVEKIGGEGSPGCRVAQIAGETPQANARARELADDLAPGFDCAKEQPRYVGNAR